tara:strand:+ start:2910 stop:3113 length:204 start_codon:yes stop_codon:yes gene_type:complete
MNLLFSATSIPTVQEIAEALDVPLLQIGAHLEGLEDDNRVKKENNHPRLEECRYKLTPDEMKARIKH